MRHFGVFAVVHRPKVIGDDPAADRSAGAPGGGRLTAMNARRGIDRLRLAEAAGAAALVLGAVALPVAWRVLDTRVATVLAGMLVILTAGVYALHAVTFDCFRMTGHRARRGFSYTRRED
jgi:hypothetical protein